MKKRSKNKIKREIYKVVSRDKKYKCKCAFCHEFLTVSYNPSELQHMENHKLRNKDLKRLYG